LRRWLQEHPECAVECAALLAIYFGAAAFIAKWPENAELVKWLSGGAAIMILARAFGSNNDKKKDPPA
jgi:hypothetical protein